MEPKPQIGDFRSAAVDLGASSGRVVVGTLSGGSIELQEVGRFRTPSFTDPETGYQCWDIDQIWSETLALLQKAAAVSPFHSVGVDSWAVDFVLLDEHSNRIGQAVCYRDKRTAGMMELVQSRIPAEQIYASTGIQFQPFNTLYQVTALAQQRPEWLAQARRLLMIPDYLHLRMCGVPSNEYTNATTAQMLRLDGSWDVSLLAAAGLPQGLMSTPIPAGTILGQTEQLNDSRIDVIAPATHDTASAVAGTPLKSTDEAYISSGTWSLMGIESLEPIATPEARRMNFTNEGGIERRFRVLKNIMGMWPLQRVCEQLNTGSVETLVEEAASLLPWRFIVNLDHPVFLNPPDMVQAIQSYCRLAGQRAPETAAELARCIIDSLALSYRKVKQELETLRGRKLTRIRIVGGGSQNRLLNQLCADACQLPVSAGPVEASVLGNLSAQWIALGALANINQARALIRSAFACEEYVPGNPIPADVWASFEQITRSSEEVECR